VTRPLGRPRLLVAAALLVAVVVSWPVWGGRLLQNLGALEAVRASVLARGRTASGAPAGWAEGALVTAERIGAGRGVYGNLARLYLSLGDNAKAEAALLKWVELAPGNALAHYELGRLLRDTGRLVPALDEWKKAGATYVLIEEGDRVAGAGEWRTALQYYSAAVMASDGPAASPERLLGGVDENRTQQHWVSHQRLGRTLYWGAKDRAAALAEYQQALEIAPTNVDLYIQVGEIYTDMANYAEANRWYERAMTIAPYDIEPLVALGANELAAGNTAEQGFVRRGGQVGPCQRCRPPVDRQDPDA